MSPIAWLPVADLLPHDYCLVEGLSDNLPFPVAVFQGTADEQTPIQTLRVPGALPGHTRLVAVQNGTHSDTYQLVLESYVQSVLHMINDRKAIHSAD